jgi:hypothetical protein
MVLKTGLTGAGEGARKGVKAEKTVAVKNMMEAGTIFLTIFAFV